MSVFRHEYGRLVSTLSRRVGVQHIEIIDEDSMASSSAPRSRHRGLRCMQLCVLAGLHCLAIGSGCGCEGDGGDASAPFLVSEQLDRFQLTDSYTRERSRFAVWRGATGTERILQQELRTGADATQAARLLADEIMRLEAVYADAVSPYPGRISNQITSTDRLQPERYQQVRSGQDWTYYRLYAGARLAYGTAPEESIGYRSVLAWLHCKKRQRFYVVKYFAPLGTPWERMEAFVFSLRCP
ncbi:MAG: hypothetical protein MJD61_17570 [Proteobacteria bacterium]|nr:hypothetical protein [Pseudomonadota bacterium]